MIQQTFEGYYSFLEEQSTERNLKERWHRARRAWNDAVAVEGSSYPHIENMFDNREKLPSLVEFPANFRAELREFQGALTKPRIAALAAISAAATAAEADWRKGWPA